MDDAPAAHRKAYRGQRCALPTALSFAHKLHSLQLRIIKRGFKAVLQDTRCPFLRVNFTSLVSGTAVSSPVEGLFPAFAEALLGAKCLAVTQEFGVRNPLSTLWALRADAWIRRQVDAVDPKRRARLETRIQASVRKAFCCFSASWEQAVMEQFTWLVRRLAGSMTAAPQR